MRVGIDISSLSSGQKIRGIGYYTSHLVEALKAEKSLSLTTFISTPPKNLDLIHFPGFNPFIFSLPLISRTPTIITVHDLIPLQFPQHFPSGIKGKLTWTLQKQVLRSLPAIITDSNYSKQEINHQTSINLNKIHPVFLAADKIFKPIKEKSLLQSIKQKYLLPDKFILYVGDINWNKNVPMLAEACIQLQLPLVVVGQAPSSKVQSTHPELQDLVKFQSLKNTSSLIHTLGYLPSEDLVALYNLAYVYVQPSRAEGFGLPVLEAFASGCPVIASNTTSLPELTGKACLDFNPYNLNDLKDSLLQLWEKPQLRQQLIELGFKQVQKFTWDKTAKQTIKVYEKVLH